MAARICVTNVREHEVLEYPLVLLEGVAEHAAQLAPAGEHLFLCVQVDAATDWTFWPIAPRSGRFKAFALLPSPGEYVLTLRLTRGDASSSDSANELTQRLFSVTFAPHSSPQFVVRFYYQKCIDAGPEGFDAPPGVDNSDAAAIAKIQLNALLLQTLTAEMCALAGQPRRTFTVELAAADGLPQVHLLQSHFTNAHARAIDDQKLIQLVHADIDALGFDAHATRRFKHAVILGCSRFNTATQRVEGHTALGGDKVGIFGSCGLHTWPQRLRDVTAACLDNRKLDAHLLFDDSCHRGTFWANYATGLGAFLHELGHTFGLGHATSGIMARGFDDMHRLLCAFEIDPHSSASGVLTPTNNHLIDGRVRVNLAAVKEVTGPGGAHWNASSVRLLQHCPWLAGVQQPTTTTTIAARVPTVSWTRDACGPVGHGLYDGEQYAFESGTPPLQQTQQDESAATLGAIRITCSDFVERIATFTRAQVASWRSTDWHSRGQTHVVVLLDGEFVTRADVRAMAYVDGLQLHTNYRTTRWFGGTGGQLSVLQAASGYAIDRFFGTVGDRFVGTLGAHCRPLDPHIDSMAPGGSAPLLLSPSAMSSAVAGRGWSDGEQHPFETQTSMLQAIAVTCDAFVETVRVLSSEQLAHAVELPDATAFGKREHVFDLVADERVVRVEVRSGHFVDSVRFVTTQRASPWFGGDGGVETTVLDIPAGSWTLCGLFGTRGDRFVGTLGALFCPVATQEATNASQSNASNKAAALQTHAAYESFSVVTGSDVLQSLPPAAPAIGVLVAMQRGSVTFVQSFASAQALDELLTRVYTTQAVDDVACFVLNAGELLLQVDVSVIVQTRPTGAIRDNETDAATESASAAVVDGICFHTTTRCSSWFGAFHSSSNTNLRFAVAPDGRAICDLAGVRTHGSLTDIVGVHCSVMDAVVPPATQQQRDFQLDSRAWLDGGNTTDVRLESRSTGGIASAHLIKKNGGDHLDCHAWDWPSSSSSASHEAHLPMRWFLPQRMLLDKVHCSRDRDNVDADAAALLVTEYIVGALDCSGNYCKAAAPPTLH